MSEVHAANNNRIAKNTLFLYGRMILIMAVSLYTSRVVLATLGTEDFGIYNVVGGFVVLFSFLNTAMVSSIQRFLNFEMGRGDKEETKRVFSMGVNCQMLIILSVLILGETVGLWFLNTYLNIPADRIVAANWIYQFSIITTCFNIFYAPYNAAIIAYEQMSVYAYVSILQALLKLGIVYLLVIGNFDKLILYGFLSFVISVIICLVYIFYCLRNFEICHYHRFWDKPLLRKMLSFSGWTLLGAVSNLGYSQGLNIIFNIFFGVIVNAAMGIANQVIAAIASFIDNFAVAFNPQIVKSYAAGDWNYLNNLIHKTSKICYFMMLLISLPIIICCNEILDIWLDKVPKYAVFFTQLVIICSLVDSINNPIWTAIKATGNVKRYNLVTSSLRLSIIPLSIIGFAVGLSPESALIVNILLNLIIQSWVLYHFHVLTEYNLKVHFRFSILPCLIITILSIPFPLLLSYILPKDIIYTLLVILSAVLTTGLLILYVGLNGRERTKIFSFAKSKLHKS